MKTLCHHTEKWSFDNIFWIELFDMALFLIGLCRHYAWIQYVREYGVADNISDIIIILVWHFEQLQYSQPLITLHNPLRFGSVPPCQIARSLLLVCETVVEPGTTLSQLSRRNQFLSKSHSKEGSWSNLQGPCPKGKKRFTFHLIEFHWE